jgi:hypothetical protein
MFSENGNRLFTHAKTKSKSNFSDWLFNPLTRLLGWKNPDEIVI